ncbi:twitching motility protein PilT [Mycobacterium kansasii]|nr:twitching motility protein PilT [Mycobacterium kansasii]
MIILDASVLIVHFESTDAHHTDATALLMTHAFEQFAASVITLAEVYAGAAGAGQSDHLHQLLAKLQIESLDLPARAARRLGELRTITKLRMPDCVVLYSAEQHNAALATFDEKLACRAADLGLVVATSQP